jgi:DNA-binding response OmpR family regulator
MENLNDKKKVLIVDDNAGLTTVLVDKLKVSGFDAVSAADGEDGLQKAFSFHPDIILLDLLMPKMDGMTMLGKLREDNWGKNCKVMILSLVEEADYIAKAVEYNVSGYIIKTDYTLSGVVDQIKIALASSKLKN